MILWVNQPCWGHPKHTRTRITTQMGTRTIWEWVGATLGAKRGCPGIIHNMELLYGTRIWVSWFWIFGPLPYLTEGTSLQVISPYVVQKSSDQLAVCVGQLTDSSQTTYQKHFFREKLQVPPYSSMRFASEYEPPVGEPVMLGPSHA